MHHFIDTIARKKSVLDFLVGYYLSTYLPHKVNEERMKKASADESLLRPRPKLGLFTL